MFWGPLPWPTKFRFSETFSGLFSGAVFGRNCRDLKSLETGFYFWGSTTENLILGIQVSISMGSTAGSSAELDVQQDHCRNCGPRRRHRRRRRCRCCRSSCCRSSCCSFNASVRTLWLGLAPLKHTQIENVPNQKLFYRTMFFFDRAW